MYERSGELDLFYEKKPQLTKRQVSLIGAFNCLSQERGLEQGAPMPIKDRDIRYYQRYNGSLGYAPDLFLFAINDLDQEYVNHRCEEIRRKIKKGK